MVEIEKCEQRGRRGEQSSVVASSLITMHLLAPQALCMCVREVEGVRGVEGVKEVEGVGGAEGVGGGGGVEGVEEVEGVGSAYLLRAYTDRGYVFCIT